MITKAIRAAQSTSGSWLIIAGSFTIFILAMALFQPALLSQGWQAGLQLYEGKQLFINTLGITILLVSWMELRFPGSPESQAGKPEFLQDMSWLVITKVFKILFLDAYVRFLYTCYQQHLDFLTWSYLASLPLEIRIIGALLLVDFLNWLHHLIRHKVPWLWHFHAVHHSQRRMSLFTDSRVHVAEYVIAETLQAIVLFALAFNAPTVTAYLVFTMFWTRFIHANVRINLGPLRYILVTPQFHRIHHSVERRHFDKNFGVIFSFWDRLFGTRYESPQEYPATGIPDHQFPLESSAHPVALIQTTMKQLIYPFSKITASLVSASRSGLPLKTRKTAPENRG